MPKAGVFKQSEVFQVLNDEQLKSKAEQEREEKYRWTTFLQKPSRPPPQRTHEQTLLNTYKPVIVRQPKPKCAPDYREPTPVSLSSLTVALSLIAFCLFLGTATRSSSRDTTNWNVHWRTGRSRWAMRSTRADWMSELRGWDFLSNICQHDDNNNDHLRGDAYVWRACRWCNRRTSERHTHRRRNEEWWGQRCQFRFRWATI